MRIRAANDVVEIAIHRAGATQPPYSDWYIAIDVSIGSDSWVLVRAASIAMRA